METAKDILKSVKDRRGISFSRLKQETGRENGTVQYHVNSCSELERKKGAVVHTQKCSECPVKDYCEEECVAKLLENRSRRKILSMKQEGMKNSHIASEFGVHRSTVTYHLSKFSEISESFFEAVEEYL